MSDQIAIQKITEYIKKASQRPYKIAQFQDHLTWKNSFLIIHTKFNFIFDSSEQKITAVDLNWNIIDQLNLDKIKNSELHLICSEAVEADNNDELQAKSSFIKIKKY